MSSSASTEAAAARPIAERVLFVADPDRDATADYAGADVVCVDVSGLPPARATSAARAAARTGLPVVVRVDAGHVELTEQLLAAGAVHVLDARSPDDVLWAALACAARMSDRWSSRGASRRARVFVREAALECRTPDEAYDMASVLSGLFSLSAQAMSGLVELLMNAIEHGNLEISHDEKTELMRTGALYDEIARRLAAPCYRDRKVTVTVIRSRDGSGVIEIADDGSGFDWRGHLAALARDYTGRGRGIALARDLGFPDLEFRDPGNRVLVKIPAAR
jgi:hypothetical protein